MDIKINQTTSKQLIKSCNNFFTIKYYLSIKYLFQKNSIFYGWGRKKSGRKAIELSKKFNTSFVLLEDGFIRSLGLGINNSPSFSIVEDNIGIYYDATTPSKLENILNSYDFDSDSELIKTARIAIDLIVKNSISKYNSSKNIDDNYFDNNEDRVLIIAQTAGDSSLKYGMIDNYSTDDMIDMAIDENPNSQVYIKIHPDVLSGKKKSDIDVEYAKKRCIIIEEDINPISLLKHFKKVYTKTSQMGFEALLVGCESVCFGMPFYAGWGITTDKSICNRRDRKLTVEEVFAGAYILYTKYYNPYRDRPSNIIDTIEEIIIQKKRLLAKNNYDILALGDSHIRIFNHRLFNDFVLKKKIDIIYVPSASAMGIKNLNSKTKAYAKFIDGLEKYNYNKIVITLGEVDTSYTIWSYSKQKSIKIEELLEKSLDNYKNFLIKITSYAPIIVLSASLPTLDDIEKCDDTISGIRKKIDISQKDRTKLTLDFNRNIKIFCQNQQDIKYIDLDTFALSKNGIVRPWLLNKKNRCDHHYRRTTYALLLIWKLKNII